MKLAAICFAAMLVLGALIAAARAHDIYHDWRTKHGASCCNDKDCAPATAWQDTAGNWFTRQSGKTYTVHPDAVLKIPSPDGRSHACILGGRVICLVPGDIRS